MKGWDFIVKNLWANKKMIFGTGIDIAKVSRFEKWVLNPGMTLRFFNENEIIFLRDLGQNPSKQKIKKSAEHLAGRFCAKEAFSKALGTGIIFDLKNIWVENKKNGQPILKICDDAKIAAENATGKKIESLNFHISISHEKEFCVCTVIIEIL